MVPSTAKTARSSHYGGATPRKLQALHPRTKNHQQRTYLSTSQHAIRYCKPCRNTSAHRVCQDRTVISQQTAILPPKSKYGALAPACHPESQKLAAVVKNHTPVILHDQHHQTHSTSWSMEPTLRSELRMELAHVPNDIPLVPQTTQPMARLQTNKPTTHLRAIQRTPRAVQPKPSPTHSRHSGTHTARGTNITPDLYPTKHKTTSNPATTHTHSQTHPAPTPLGSEYGTRSAPTPTYTNYMKHLDKDAPCFLSATHL